MLLCQIIFKNVLYKKAGFPLNAFYEEFLYLFLLLIYSFFFLANYIFSPSPLHYMLIKFLMFQMYHFSLLNFGIVLK